MTKEEQRARDAVVMAAMRWMEWANTQDEWHATEFQLAAACACLAAIQKKEKRRVR